jgi:hypothetical protein
VVLLVLPLGLALAAACVHRYPYGGARVVVYATPGLAILTAAGAAAAWRRLSGGLRPWRLALTALLLLTIPNSLYRTVVVWERPQAAAAAAFVEARRRPGDAVVGNDGIHAYYCRRMGAAFTCGGFGETPAPVGGRVWVLYTDAQPHERRVRDVRTWLPGDWRLLAAEEFHSTSVVLLAGPENAASLPTPEDGLDFP